MDFEAALDDFPVIPADGNLIAEVKSAFQSDNVNLLAECIIEDVECHLLFLYLNLVQAPNGIGAVVLERKVAALHHEFTLWVTLQGEPIPWIHHDIAVPHVAPCTDGLATVNRQHLIESPIAGALHDVIKRPFYHR
jgi:hypothetical protein